MDPLQIIKQSKNYLEAIIILSFLANVFLEAMRIFSIVTILWLERCTSDQRHHTTIITDAKAVPVYTGVCMPCGCFIFQRITLMDFLHVDHESQVC